MFLSVFKAPIKPELFLHEQFLCILPENRQLTLISTSPILHISTFHTTLPSCAQGCCFVSSFDTKLTQRYPDILLQKSLSVFPCLRIIYWYVMYLHPHVDADGASATARVAITLKETNDFPPLVFPLSDSVCRGTSNKRSALFLTAVDEDRPPHAAPFTFVISDDLSVNWTLRQVNGEKMENQNVMRCYIDIPVILPQAAHQSHVFSLFVFLSSDTHAVLQPSVDLEAGEYAVMVHVFDSGSPVLESVAQVNVTVCFCDSFGDCKSEAGAVLGSSVGLSFIALIIIASAALLMCECRLHQRYYKHDHTFHEQFFCFCEKDYK